MGREEREKVKTILGCISKGVMEPVEKWQVERERERGTDS